MAEKNRKLYLDLKLSTVERFRRNVRWVAQSATKESQFEKPYLDDGEYRKMHLEFPEPDWPKVKPLDYGSLGEAKDTPPDRVTRYNGPYCQNGVFTMDCEGGTGSAYLWALPPHSGVRYHWEVTVLEGPARVRITREDSSLEFSVDLLDENYTGNIRLKIVARLEGHFSTTIRYVKDGPFGPEVGVEVVGKEGLSVECDDESERVECEKEEECVCAAIAWDSTLSPTTIGASSSALVGALAELSCGPFKWSVTGIDVTLAAYTTTDLTNTLITGADACGVISVLVRTCDNKTVTGRLACPTGVFNPFPEDFLFPCEAVTDFPPWTPMDCTCYLYAGRWEPTCEGPVLREGSNQVWFQKVWEQLPCGMGPGNWGFLPWEHCMQSETLETPSYPCQNYWSCWHTAPCICCPENGPFSCVDEPAGPHIEESYYGGCAVCAIYYYPMYCS